MSTWIVQLQIEIPNDDACTDDPAAWDWYGLMNTGEPARWVKANKYSDPAINVTVLSTKGVAS